MPGDVEMVNSGRIGCKVQLRRIFVEPELDSFYGILIISEDFLQGSRPGPHEFHPKSPGLQVSLNGEMTHWFSDLENHGENPEKMTRVPAEIVLVGFH